MRLLLYPLVVRQFRDSVTSLSQDVRTLPNILTQQSSPSPAVRSLCTASSTLPSSSKRILMWNRMFEAIFFLLAASVVKAKSGCDRCASNGQCSQAYNGGPGKYCGGWYDATTNSNAPCCCPNVFQGSPVQCMVSEVACDCHVEGDNYQNSASYHSSAAEVVILVFILCLVCCCCALARKRWRESQTYEVLPAVAIPVHSAAHVHVGAGSKPSAPMPPAANPGYTGDG